MSDRVPDEPTLRVTDALGHDLPAMTIEVRHQMIGWLELEDAAGDLSPGLRELRDRLRDDEADDE